MKTSEDLLKELILSQYKSLREFTTVIGMPYTTVDSLLKRGIKKASVDNVLKICSFLNISTDALVNGRIEYINNEEPTTLAAHFEGEQYSDEEMDEIMQFAEFVKNRKNKDV